MDNKYLSGVLYYTHRVPLSRIFTLRNYYESITHKDITNMKLDVVKGTIPELEWALNHPDFDFNSILPTRYSNDVLLRWFKIYLENLHLCLEMYEKGKFIITAEDIVPPISS